MAPTATQALEVFSERDQIPESLSILTYTEEEEIQDYFDAEWEEQDAVVTTPLSRRASVEAICSSCAVTDSSSVLGVCTTPSITSTTPTRSISPCQSNNPLLVSIGETLSLSKVVSVAPLYRPSELGINLTSVIGDPRSAAN